MSMNFRLPSALLAAGALAFTAAACGDDEEKTTATPGAAAKSDSGDKPKPAAQIDSLSGRTTKVTLDEGFVEALTSLKVTPGPVGDATISKAGVATFPISGGNVTYYSPDSGVMPYVQGLINHDNAGLSLEAGGKKVELENFDVDPGKSVLTGDVSVDGEEGRRCAAVLPRRPHAGAAADERRRPRPCSRARPSSSSRRPPTCST